MSFRDLLSGQTDECTIEQLERLVAKRKRCCRICKYGLAVFYLIIFALAVLFVWGSDIFGLINSSTQNPRDIRFDISNGIIAIAIAGIPALFLVCPIIKKDEIQKILLKPPTNQIFSEIIAESDCSFETVKNVVTVLLALALLAVTITKHLT